MRACVRVDGRAVRACVRCVRACGACLRACVRACFRVRAEARRRRTRHLSTRADRSRASDQDGGLRRASLLTRESARGRERASAKKIRSRRSCANQKHLKHRNNKRGGSDGVLCVLCCSEATPDPILNYARKACAPARYIWPETKFCAKPGKRGLRSARLYGWIAQKSCTESPWAREHSPYKM